MRQLLVRWKLFEWCRRQTSNTIVDYECHRSGGPSGRWFNSDKVVKILGFVVAKKKVDMVWEARKLYKAISLSQHVKEFSA
jgi:hypothetical protein